jgi:hypothetical protein
MIQVGFCCKLVWAVIVLLLASQLLPSQTPWGRISEFEEFRNTASVSSLDSFLALFDQNGDRGMHRVLSPFCRNVGVPSCSRISGGSFAITEFCRRLLEKCNRYHPDNYL